MLIPGKHLAKHILLVDLSVLICKGAVLQPGHDPGIQYRLIFSQRQQQLQKLPPAQMLKFLMLHIRFPPETFRVARHTIPRRSQRRRALNSFSSVTGFVEKYAQSSL